MGGNVVQENLLIKYVEADNSIPGFNLGILGESLSGFDALLKEFCRLSRINGDIEIKATRVREGSIDVFAAFAVAAHEAPFHNITHLYDFLQLASPELHKQALDFFGSLGNAHKTVNDYFRENQFDNTVLAALLGALVAKLFEGSKVQKKHIKLRDRAGNTIPLRYAKRMRQLVLGGRYKRAIRPLAENNASHIKIIALGSQEKIETVINDDNLGDYLPDTQKILPAFINGKQYKLLCEIAAIQSTKGETLKLRVFNIDPKYKLLVAHPEEGKSTEDYVGLYKQKVVVRAEVYRKSMFKRPELIIKSIEPQQIGLL